MEQEPIARTALDEMVESDQDQMLKAMIPYLPSSGQRFLSVYTKVRELRNTMSLFQSSRRTDRKSTRLNSSHRSQSRMPSSA